MSFCYRPDRGSARRPSPLASPSKARAGRHSTPHDALTPWHHAAARQSRLSLVLGGTHAWQRASIELRPWSAGLALVTNLYIISRLRSANEIGRYRPTAKRGPTLIDVKPQHIPNTVRFRKPTITHLE